MAKTPTQGERADFAGFCRNATDAQLREIIHREAEARRRVYADIAKDEARRRGIDLEAEADRLTRAYLRLPREG